MHTQTWTTPPAKSPELTRARQQVTELECDLAALRAQINTLRAQLQREVALRADAEQALTASAVRTRELEAAVESLTLSRPSLSAA